MRFKNLCRIVILLCAVLWFFAPFMTVNSDTIGHQASAFMLFFYALLSNIAAAAGIPAFWAALISAIGIVVCYFTIGKKNATARIAAIVTDVSLAIIFIIMLYQAGRDISGVTDVVGFGYIGIFVLLLLVCFMREHRHKI
jgi:hypothetical protein